MHSGFSQAMQEGVPGLPIIDQGVHAHACHHALTWPAGLHVLGLRVVTWQCKATTWHERAIQGFRVQGSGFRV